MIVLAFNYHLSIITIMGKSDNVLYINILLNVRCVLKLTGMWSCLSALFEEILCTVSDYNPVEYLLFKHKQFLILVDGHYESRMHK